MIGAIGSLFGQSPEHLGQSEAKQQGSDQLDKELADGLSVTINLCSGLSRFGLGREPAGKMDRADAGETKQVPIELQPGGLMVFGPGLVGEDGYTANVDSPAGFVRVELACRDQAERVAAAYAAGEPLPKIETLASKDIRGKGSLRVPHASCQVSLIARLLAPDAPMVAFQWARPENELARSTGGPLISCAPPAK